MPQATVNYLAIIVAAIINLVLGFLWYGPLFGRRWLALSNITQEQMRSGGIAKTTAGSFVIALIVFYVLSLVVDWTGAKTVGAGLTAGFWVWLGFVGTVTFNSVLYEFRPTALWALNNGYHLLTLLIGGALLAVWV
jgi:hypothetical protein